MPDLFSYKKQKEGWGRFGLNILRRLKEFLRRIKFPRRI